MSNNLTFHRYNAEAARERRELVEDVFRRSYAAAIDSGDPFEDPAAFMIRFDAYTAPGRSEGFELIIVSVDDIVAGQTWGWPLKPQATWWNGLRLDDPDLDHDEFITETGHRTFALSEIMVDRAFTRRGIATALHDELLGSRTETRASLLVEPENAAYKAYRRWGWERVGTLTTHWPNTPTFDVLMYALGR
ncbi:GNAT family N-acetyltransferase [Nocardia asteroides]|uniref:GNAT family N-acetyltransferase n=1 Tax=Nocardia asteroides TaxID=1824 RepID=UPI0037CCC1B8